MTGETKEQESTSDDEQLLARLDEQLAEAVDDQLEELRGFGRILRTVGSQPDLDYRRLLERREEMQRLVDVLGGEGNRSVVLVGPPGCGKTAMCHALAKVGVRPGEDGAPAYFVLETSANMLLVGTKYSGEWETRVERLISLAQTPVSVLLFFTDLHLVPDIGRTVQGEDNAAAFLAPYIRSGAIAVIGECDDEQFQRLQTRDPGFARLFTCLRVDALSTTATERVLERLAGDVGPGLVPGAGRRIVELATAFGRGRSLPGAAVELLSAAARSRRPDPDARDAVGGPLTARCVLDVLTTTSGLPGRLLDDEQPLRLEEVRAFLNARVLGQPQAVEAMVDRITLIKAGLSDPDQPLGVLLFVGPTGVGKTELAKAFAEFVFGSADRLLRIDMSEYKDYHAFEKLIGNPQSGDPALRDGMLTSRVRQQPFSVVLLDEIEKAHGNVFDLLLQVFDDGRLTDPYGRTTNFKQCVLIMTSNAGSDVGRGAAVGFQGDGESARTDAVQGALRDTFRPELLNRIDRVVEFRPLGRDQVRTIAQRELGKVLLRSGIVRRGLRIDVDKSVIDVLAEAGYSPEFGARPLHRAVENHVCLPLARAIIKLGGDATGSVLRLRVRDGELQVRTVVRATRPDPEDLAVRVEDPDTDRRRTLAGRDWIARAERMRTACVGLSESDAARECRDRRTHLERQSADVDFWDDVQSARCTLGELHRLTGLLGSLDGLAAAARSAERDLQAALAAAATGAGGTPAGIEGGEEIAIVQRKAQRVMDLERRCTLLRFTLDARRDIDYGDALVQVRALGGEGREAGDGRGRDAGFVFEVASMYRAWAQRHRFGVSVIDERLDQQGRVESAVLWIEGPAAFGILRSEAGVHEAVGRAAVSAVPGHTPGERDRELAAVRVLALPDAPVARPPKRPSCDRATGRGRLIDRYTHRVRLRDPQTGDVFEATSGLDADAARDALVEWWGAECRVRSASEQLAEGDGVVRRYTYSPVPKVRDLRTDERVALDVVLRGAMDPLLAAARIEGGA